MKFIDEAQIFVTAGNGGNGCISFRREKYVSRGGPDGGDGGRGGSVFLVGRRNLENLYDLRIRPHYRAGRGGHGKGKKMAGKKGKDVFIDVPLGVVISNGEKTLGEILTHNQELLIAKGGEGGRGNVHFLTASDLAPRTAESGRQGEIKTLKIVLKLISDIGLVGLPNSGKSTLLNVLTNAKSKIGNYPFTTLSPNLGVIRSNQGNVVVADMPGIVEGAHLGKGLGLRFLRHIERTTLIILVIDATTEDPLEHHKCLLEEFKEHSMNLLKKPRVVVFNKIDLLKSIPKYNLSEKTLYISALTGQGIKSLIKLIANEDKI
jgi:GTP-binding protein